MDPRAQAVATLAELERARRTAKEVWDGPRPGAETALVLGTLRRRGTLDAILAAHSTRKLHRLDETVRAALRAGLFELLYMETAAPHAVVDAAVKAVRAAGLFRDAGFVNAVLRAIVRGSRKEDAGKDPRRALPCDGGFVVFRRAVFPDPAHDPAGFLAARGSTPPWIARRRLAELGFSRALACLDLQARTPPVRLRCVRGDAAFVRAALDVAGIPWEDGPLPGMLTLPSRARASAVLDAAGSRVVFQDAVAAQVAPFLAPPPGSRVLDWCAAPGGKTMHLAETAGLVVACDVEEARLARVAENAARLGLRNVECVLLPADLPRDFDAALVDAPCSNTGVLARRPEARWRVKERHLAALAQRQLRILRDAAQHVRPGGALVYSTCSLEAEENSGVVAAFLARGGFSLEEARTVQPDEADGDGGFMARMRRV